MDDPNPYLTPSEVPDANLSNLPHPFRIPSIAGLALLACLPLLRPNLLLVTLGFAAANMFAFPVLVISGASRLAGVPALAVVFFVATLFLTNWGFSMYEPVVRMNWFAFVPGILLTVCWVSWPVLTIRSRSFFQRMWSS